MRHQLIGSAGFIGELQRELDYAARCDAKVLLTGESGVGKEVVAHLIHQEGRRRLAPLVAINCAGVPDSLLESELFGHVRGSFTDAYRDKRGLLEQAEGGTVFLDEIGEMSLRMQAALLRFLENGEIQRVGAGRSHSAADVRIVAATNRDLFEQIAAKQFREDLYYRLNVIHIAIPPLRQRREDIPPLLGHFIRTSAEAHRLPPPTLLEETVERLCAYSWPGNVRELKNIAERLVVRARSGVIPPADLPKEILGKWSPPIASSLEPPAPRLVPGRLYERMAVEGESFWVVVYEPFMARDVTREDLRTLVSRGLEQTNGSYKLLLEVFNVAAKDYKRLLRFLRTYQCHVPFQKPGSIAALPQSGVDAGRRTEMGQPLGRTG